MQSGFTLILIGLAQAVSAEPSLASTGEAEPLLQAVIECRAKQGDAARLSCYDVAVGRLSEARAKKEIVVLDRATVMATRKSLFGFSLPRLPFFDANTEEDDDQIDEIDATARSAREIGYGYYVITLEDGASWRTIEAGRGSSPSAGSKIRIRRAALGSYLMNIDGQRAVRARREN